jgi:putative glutamine amidotransferase
MKPRIAIPLPHGDDVEYAKRAIPQYERAVQLAGGEPVPIPLDRPPAEVMKLIERCDGVLLPGSKADVDPAKFGRARHPKTEAADAKRDTVDELLLQDAYNMRKPILGICYGLQILNVYRSGTLLQHIESAVNHEAGRKVPMAHEVEVEPRSKLAEIVAGNSPVPSTSIQANGRPASSLVGSSEARRETQDEEWSNLEGTASNRAFTQRGQVFGTAGSRAFRVPVNSSHHQSAEVVGDGLKIVARSPQDGIIEAIEGTSPDHFVLAVQWHPERSYEDDEHSRAIFRALVEAAKEKHRQLAGEFERAT